MERSRWTLAHLLVQLEWLRVRSAGALSHLLDRLDIHYKRARDYVHSPDPLYREKLDYIEQLSQEARKGPGSVEFLYLDEFTYYRQPTIAPAYEEAGHSQPLAEHSYHANTPTRVLACIQAFNAQLTYYQGSRIDCDQLVRFYRRLHDEVYPQAMKIYIVQDNWPVHTHPDVLLALEEQVCPFPFYRPSNWPTEPSAKARKRWSTLNLPIQVVPLPTYASWCNPIEKVWRKLRQEVLHLHRLSSQLPLLRQRVGRWLHQYSGGSPSLLKYVGLLAPD